MMTLNNSQSNIDTNENPFQQVKSNIILFLLNKILYFRAQNQEMSQRTTTLYRFRLKAVWSDQKCMFTSMAEQHHGKS